MSEIKVLKFWAQWCRPCSVLASELEGLDITNHNVDDKDSAEALSRFKVRNLPTLVFLKDDNEIHRHVGMITRKAYLETLEKLNNN